MEKDFENYLEDINDFIFERTKKGLKVLHNTDKYKKINKEYQGLKNHITNMIGKEELDDLIDIFNILSVMESNYYYLQGYKDGMILNEI